MSTLRSVGIGVGVAAAVAGLLFGTGLVSLKKANSDGDKDHKAGDAEGGIDPELESLSYLNTDQLSQDEKKKSGVTAHLRDKAEAGGISLSVPIGSGGEYKKIGRGKPLRLARLIDMDGVELHSWEDDVKRGTTKNPGWAMARFAPDGFLYAVDNRIALVKLDWDSKAQWDVKGRFHHDVAIRDDGGVVALEERPVELEDDGDAYNLLDDGFVWVGTDGAVEKRFWIHDALKDEAFYQKHIEQRNGSWRKHRRKKHRRGGSLPRADFIHANTVELLPTDMEGIGKKGDVLTALREMDMLAVFSAEDGKLLWTWGAEDLDRPHDPDVLESGAILVFDNGWHRGKSRVIEVDPTSQKIGWSYEGTKAHPLWSKKRGLSQQLENGNILANATQRGQVLEVTREGEVVWEYFNPDIIKDFRVPIRFTRLQGTVKAKAKALLEERGGVPRGNVTKKRRR